MIQISEKVYIYSVNLYNFHSVIVFIVIIVIIIISVTFFLLGNIILLAVGVT